MQVVVSAEENEREAKRIKIKQNGHTWFILEGDNGELVIKSSPGHFITGEFLNHMVILRQR